MRKTYSKKDIKEFLALQPEAESFLDKKAILIEEDGTLFSQGAPLYHKHQNTWIPSLQLLQEHKIVPRITVDKGTPPFIAKGADLMRPGVISCEEFSEGDIVVLVDEVHDFPLATGRALHSSTALMERKEGKVVKILFNLRSSNS